MKRAPKSPLLAVGLGLALGALLLGSGRSARATVPCPIGAEVGELTIESVTVDGVVQTYLEDYTAYHVSLGAVGYSSELSLQATSSPVYLSEGYDHAP